MAELDSATFPFRDAIANPDRDASQLRWAFPLSLLHDDTNHSDYRVHAGYEELNAEGLWEWPESFCGCKVSLNADQ